jgi:hypothetical protein
MSDISKIVKSIEELHGDERERVRKHAEYKEWLKAQPKPKPYSVNEIYYKIDWRAKTDDELAFFKTKGTTMQKLSAKNEIERRKK